jgi:hypothetical protein
MHGSSRSIPRRLLRACFLLALILLPVAADAREPKQNARIAHLIGSVEKLEGAVFIRNGTGYSPDKAASHLRLKLSKAGDKIKTAEHFIDHLAAKSSVSGDPYKIRKADGSLVNARDFFYLKLRAYDKEKG